MAKYCGNSPLCEEDRCSCDEWDRITATEEPEKDYGLACAIVLAVIIIGFIAGEIFIRTI